MNNLFSDVFSSQTIGFSSILTVIISMVFALAAGYVITVIYRRNYRGPSAAEMDEMRSTFGEGATVVDVLAGVKICL